MSFSRSSRPRSWSCAALLLGELVDEHGAGGLLVVGVGGDAALLGELVERVAAARGVEQVGGDLGVEDEVRRDVAERLGVVGDDGAVAGGGDELGRVVDLARRARSRRRRRRAKRHFVLARDQLALGDLGRRRRRATSSSPVERVDVVRRGPRGPATVDRVWRLGARDRLQPRRRRAPPRAGAAGRAAPSRGRPVRRFGAVGLARELDLEVDVDRDVADHRRELLGHARVVGVLGQVLLALGAGDLVDAGEDALEVAEALQQLGGGLVADAGDAGDVVARCRP